MGRRRDEEQTRQNRTRNHSGGYTPGQGYERRDRRDEARYGPYYDREGARYYENDYGQRHYDERQDDSYYREREQRQETRRTGMWVIGAIVIAVIALLGVMAITGDDSSQTAQQAPQQQAPEQPVQPQAPQQPQAPAAPGEAPASSEQVEGMRADIERQLQELRQSINQLRLEIWSFFTSQQNQEQQEGSS